MLGFLPQHRFLLSLLTEPERGKQRSLPRSEDLWPMLILGFLCLAVGSPTAQVVMVQADLAEA